ncbi:energy-coupling factor transporter transmembrane component T family protein [Streptomyces cavernicola]|uniref:Energy-coupling factor transporter transmembrane component T n=1 Tax=Streptomyces cavernicola TaxID=3043613 RepID=A0ABT6S785_9ACTN|nr:energy-coupling factor transporter transmembrane component T [Streptomyces sp. B-S-A6]MDI3403298.1 energy-coupling factor transporter transmembrane component T [Streptomyces sp. B-S-A6]
MIGYAPGDGFLHRRNAVTKLSWAASLSATVFLMPEAWMVWTVVALVALTTAAGGLARRLIRPTWTILLPFGISLAVLQGLFNPDNTTTVLSLGPVAFGLEGIVHGVLILGRLATVLLTFFLLLLTTTPKQLTAGLAARGVSPRFGYAILAAIEFVPDMQRRSQAVLASQQARGLDVKGSLGQRVKAFASLLGPLITGALIASDTRAMALEARGFSARGERTHLALERYGTVDRTAVWTAGLLFLAALGLKVL